MGLNLVFVLCLTILSSVKISFCKAKSVPVSTAKNQSLLDDIIATDTLKANDDDSFTRSSESTKSVFDYTSVSCNSSSNCTNLSQLHFGQNDIDIEKMRKITLMHEGPTPIEVLFVQNVTANTSAFAKTIRLKMMKTDLSDESHKIKLPMPNNSYSEMMETGFTKGFARERRAKVTERARNEFKHDSVQLVLRKIFPDNFRTNSSSSKNNQQLFDLTSNSRKRFRVKARPVGRFSENSFYFRDAPGSATEETSSIAENETSSIATDETSSIAIEETSSIAIEETSSIAAEETSSIAAEETSSIATEETSTISGETVLETDKTEDGCNITKFAPGVNYHYHFHYFGGVVHPTSSTFHKTTTTETTG